MTDFYFDFSWVPEQVGGHHAPPYEGMRTAIRWNRYLADSLKNEIDVQWRDVKFSPDDQQGTARCTLSGLSCVPEGWIVEGELIEFLNGFRVLAVGKIKAAPR